MSFLKGFIYLFAREGRGARAGLLGRVRRPEGEEKHTPCSAGRVMEGSGVRPHDPEMAT